jgi:hypothetical protein
MSVTARLVGGLSVLILSMATIAGCGTRPDVAAKSVDGIAYGVTREPFRERWWQYCERGVSWANGGFWAEAEADLRQCLALRRTDSRRARTYGMHFIQCFAHRELGAVLIELGRLDEAEAELQLSMAQEPSAKAEFLLRRIRQARGQEAVPPTVVGPVVIDPAAPRAEPAVATAPDVIPAPSKPDLSATDSRILITSISGDGSATTLSGRLDASAGTPLWLVPPTGAPTPIAVDAQGAFTAAVPVGSGLASGGGITADGTARSANLIMTINPPLPTPTLTIQGPADDARVQSVPVWFRFSADSSQGLRSLTVIDAHGNRCGGLDLSGVRAGGMVPVTLGEGNHELFFILQSAGEARSEIKRRLSVTAAPAQNQGWRAPALLVGLQPSGIGQEIRARDSAFYERSVLHGERFNLVAPEGAVLQRQELAWAQAGLVTTTTAVRAGREVQARYVLLGTLTRGRDDAECFLRMVNCTTGQVVATTDAYDRASDDFNTQAFFTALAARLRQAFPVHQSRLSSVGDRLVLTLGTADGVSEGLRFHILNDDRRTAAGIVEVVACRAHDSNIRWITSPSTVATGLVISE